MTNRGWRRSETDDERDARLAWRRELSRAHDALRKSQRETRRLVAEVRRLRGPTSNIVAPLERARETGNAIHLVDAMSTALAWDEPLPDEVRTWLREASARYMKGVHAMRTGGATPRIDECLSVPNPDEAHGVPVGLERSFISDRDDAVSFGFGFLLCCFNGMTLAAAAELVAEHGFQIPRRGGRPLAGSLTANELRKRHRRSDLLTRWRPVFDRWDRTQILACLDTLSVDEARKHPLKTRISRDEWDRPRARKGRRPV